MVLPVNALTWGEIDHLPHPGEATLGDIWEAITPHIVDVGMRELRQLGLLHQPILYTLSESLYHSMLVGHVSEGEQDKSCYF